MILQQAGGDIKTLRLLLRVLTFAFSGKDVDVEMYSFFVYHSCILLFFIIVNVILLMSP